MKELISFKTVLLCSFLFLISCQREMIQEPEIISFGYSLASDKNSFFVIDRNNPDFAHRLSTKAIDGNQLEISHDIVKSLGVDYSGINFVAPENSFQILETDSEGSLIHFQNTAEAKFWYVSMKDPFKDNGPLPD